MAGMMFGNTAAAQDTIRASRSIRPGMSKPAPVSAADSTRGTRPDSAAASVSVNDSLRTAAPSDTSRASRNIRPGGTYARPGTPGADSTRKKEKLITKLKETKIPPELMYRLVNMPPQQMQHMEEEWKRNDIDEETGEEMVFTTKLKFYNDYIIGFVAKAPLNTSNKGIIEPIMIDIPVIYCSTQSIDMQPHCGRMSELYTMASEYKITAWKMKIEEEVVNFGDPLKLGGNAPGGGKKGKRKKKDKGGFTGQTGVE